MVLTNLLMVCRTKLQRITDMLKRIVVLMVSFFMGAMACYTAVADEMVLFTADNMTKWSYQVFDDIAETDYKVVNDAVLNHPVLLAKSDKGASGYSLKKKIDFNKTPWLHFLWRVDAAQDNPKEGSTAGDDFALRFYLTRQSGLHYQTLNLVYSNARLKTEQWESPYSVFINEIQVYAIAQHQTANIGKWQSSHINIADVWKSVFDSEPTIELIGLMTDGDSALLQVQARYGSVIVSTSADSPFLIPYVNQ